jgi:hypothetical protein
MSIAGDGVDEALTRRLYIYDIVTVQHLKALMAAKTRKVRKNLRLTQAKLDRAKRILGTETETETIEQALDLVAFREEVIGGVRRLAGSGSLHDVIRDGAA